MSPRRQIAVAGAGVAGMAAALLLRRAGEDVVVFERFERPQPLGSGLMLQPTGMAVLAELGLDEALRARSAAIERLLGKTGPRDKVVLDVRYAALGAISGLGVHRASLFDVLFQALQADGVPVETDRDIVAAPAATGGRRRLEFRDGTSAGPFDLVVDGLGVRSPLPPDRLNILAYGALWATVDWPDGHGFDFAALEQRYEAARRMVGLMPLGRGPTDATAQAAFFWSLKRADYPKWRDAGIAAWKAEVLRLWPAMTPVLDKLIDRDDLVFAEYAHRTTRRPAEPGLVHIGDSWHATSPQLGQGANMALLDAYGLARGLQQHTDVGQALTAFVKSRRSHIRLYQAISRLFTPVYQSDGSLLPMLRDHIASPVSQFPPVQRLLATLVAGNVGAPMKRLWLESKIG